MPNALIAATPRLRWYATWFADGIARLVNAAEYARLHRERVRFFTATPVRAREYAREIAHSRAEAERAEADISAAMTAAAAQRAA